MSLSDHSNVVATFDDFVRDVGERVRRGLVARYGVEVGSEAAAEAMRVAWERWPEVTAMSNPAGFLFRVGQSQARPHLRWWRRRRRLLVEPAETRSASDEVHVDDELAQALERLSEMQRAVLLLVRAHGYSYGEAADVLDISEAAVTNHVHRGSDRLRKLLEVPE